MQGLLSSPACDPIHNVEDPSSKRGVKVAEAASKLAHQAAVLLGRALRIHSQKGKEAEAHLKARSESKGLSNVRPLPERRGAAAERRREQDAALQEIEKSRRAKDRWQYGGWAALRATKNSKAARGALLAAAAVAGDGVGARDEVSQ